MEETATVLASCDQPEPTDDCGWSPGGREFAYADDTCSPTPCAQGVWDAGRVHVVDATGDETMTPVGEMDRVLGWTGEGIVVARISASAGATASGGGTRVFLEGDFGASFPDYLLDPATGGETYLGTTDAFAAEGDDLWESGESNSALLRYDLATRTSVAWPVPPPGPSPAASWDDNGVVPMGFDAQGHPLVVTGDGRFIVLTGPDAARTIGAASQKLRRCAQHAGEWGRLGGRPLRSGLDARRRTPDPGARPRDQHDLTIDTLYWDRPSGLQDLGAASSGRALDPAAHRSVAGQLREPHAGQETHPAQQRPVFAGQPLNS